MSPLAPGLYLVATPIGNLEDITLRALRVLRECDRICCEDTRQTAKLLAHYALEKPLVSLHAHNEQARSFEIISELREEARIAVVSDAGTPGISDPGALLTRAAIEAGIAVYSIPGPNAALAALVASGLPAERFLFHGFLPEKSGARRTYLEALLPGTHIFHEAPHRILDTLADLAALIGPARVALARELTKLHEEFLRGSPSAVRAELAARDRVRGEMVLVVELSPAPAEAPAQTLSARMVELQKSEGLDEKDALKRAARERGLGKSEAYREWQRERGR